MGRRGRFGIVWLIGTLVVAGIVGAIAYNAGTSAGLAGSAASAGHLVVVPAFGFGLFGLFPILFLVLIAFAFFARRPRWYGPGGAGARGFGGPESWLTTWHQQAHGGTPPQGGVEPQPERPREA